MVRRLTSAEIDGASIVEVVPAAEGCRIRRADHTIQPLPSFSRDEIARMLE